MLLLWYGEAEVYLVFDRVKYGVNKETNEAVAIKILDKVSMHCDTAFCGTDVGCAWLGCAPKEKYECSN
jgi:hypothetical protein